MASASPVAFVIFLALIGSIVLPILWWLLAFWQKKYHLLGLFKVSVVLSVVPILSFWTLFYGERISAKYSLIFFSLTPFLSVVLLAIFLVLTVVKVRRNGNL